MALPQPVLDSFKAIDDETTRVADLFASLLAEIKVGMTQAAIDEVVKTGTAAADRLRGIAKNPDDPIPPGPLPVFNKKR